MRSAKAEALWAYAGTTLICIVLWQARAYLGSFLQLGIALTFLLTARWLLDRRGADWASYGLTIQPLGRGLAALSMVVLLVFPLFLIGFVAYYDFICKAGWMSRVCAGWLGWRGAALRLPPDFVSQTLGQVVAIALPEEFFYRGYLQGRLTDVWPNRWRILGASIGPALLAQSALFGVAHFLVDGNPLRMATFFPALVFGWMRQRSGSILAPTLFHALCNLFSDTLHQSFFR